MRLRRAILNNIYQHRHLDVEITGSVVGVVGENGAGKSKFLSAIGEGVHGEFHQNKDRVVTWGESKGSSYFEFDQLPGGLEFSVLREFPSGSATLKSGNTKITGASKVNAWILDALKMEKSALMNFVFVDQTAINDILFARPTEKQRAAQRFFNLGAATTIEQTITRFLSDLSMDSMADRLPAFNSELIVAVEEMKVAEGAATGLRMIDQVESEITSIDAAVEKGSRMNAVLQVIARLNGELDKDKALSVEQNARYNEHYATYMQTDSGSWKAEFDRHTSAQAAIDLHKASVTAYEKAAEEYQKVLVTSADDPQTLEAREAGVLADYNIASVKVAELEGVLKNIGTSEVCPTCGSKIDISSRPSLEADLATWKPRRNRLANELAEIRSSLAALRKSIKEWNEKTSRVKHEHDRLKVDMESRVKNLPDFAPVPERWSCAIAAREAELKRLTEMYATLGATSKRIQETEKKIQDEVAASKFSVAEIAASSPVNITEMQERVKVLRAESARISEVDERIRAARTRVETLRGQIQEARAAELSNTAVRESRTVLERVRAGFHPSGAPRTVITRSNRMIESRINHYLGVMNSKFTINAMEGFDFEAIFPHGIGRDSELSVGQKTALAWAFRLAGCETFSSSAGFMTMDEPSAPMDSKVLQGFINVIGILKELAASHGMQFLIATHSPEIVQECDQIIKIK